MKKEKKSGCMAGIALGSALRIIAIGIQMFAKLLAKLLVFFGLWLPLVYSLFGLALFYFLKFNPLEWTLEGQLYMSGFVACITCSVIISIRNLIIKPVKSVAKGFVTPIWSKVNIEEDIEVSTKKGKLKNTFKAPETLDLEKPRPSIYYSTLEENTLIHEYKDKFEIYRLEGNKAKLERVEYKDEK